MADEIPIPEVPSLHPEAAVVDEHIVKEEPKEEESIQEEEEPKEFSELPEDDKIAKIQEKYGNDNAQLAKAYLNSQQMTVKRDREIDELKGVVEDLKKFKEQPEEPAKDEFDQDLILEDPAKAISLIEQRIEAKLNKQQQEQKIQVAEEYNNSLVTNRSKELLLETAKMMQDKAGIEKFSNPHYVPTDGERAAIEGKLNAETQWIRNNLQPDWGTLKFRADSFSIAQRVLYGSEMIKEAEQRGANNTLNQLDNAQPAAVVLSPKGSKATHVHDLSNVQSRDKAKEVGRTLSDEELQKAIRESEPL